ncbi:Uncharacterised protein [Mycobacteroides abscessus subsp. abscessus]|nr:Uncharacterised protein [Mycobacteroides abscessus subsp. abscessus]
MLYAGPVQANADENNLLSGCDLGAAPELSGFDGQVGAGLRPDRGDIVAARDPAEPLAAQ